MMILISDIASTDALLIQNTAMFAHLIIVNVDVVHATGLLTPAPTPPTQAILIPIGLNPGTLTLRAPHPKDHNHHHLHQKRNGLRYQETIESPDMQVTHFVTNLGVYQDFA